MYCSQQDLVARFSEQELIDLTDREMTGHINNAVIDQAIADACAEIDGYLGGRYQLPLVNVPSALKPLACNIARYKLYDEEPSTTIAKRYEDALKFLKAVSKGEISLGVDQGGNKAPVQDLAEIQSAGSVFAREKSRGFI